MKKFFNIFFFFLLLFFFSGTDVLAFENYVYNFDDCAVSATSGSCYLDVKSTLNSSPYWDYQLVSSDTFVSPFHSVVLRPAFNLYGNPTNVGLNFNSVSNVAHQTQIQFAFSGAWQYPAGLLFTWRTPYGSDGKVSNQVGCYRTSETYMSCGYWNGDSPATYTYLAEDISMGTWFNLEAEASSTASFTRFRVSTSTWSDWVPNRNSVNWYDNLDIFQVMPLFNCQGANCASSPDNLNYRLYVDNFSANGVGFNSIYPFTLETGEDCGIFCQALSWAFIPSEATMSKFTSDLPALLESKTPFSYFYEAQDIFGDLSVGSSTVALTLAIPSTVGTSTIPFFSPSMSGASEFASGVRPFFIAGLWIAFGLYLMKRVMDFNL